MKLWGKEDRVGAAAEKIVLEHLRKRYPEGVVYTPEPDRAHVCDFVLLFKDRPASLIEVKLKTGPTRFGTFGVDTPDFDCYRAQNARLVLMIVDMSSQSILWGELSSILSETDPVFGREQVFIHRDKFHLFSELSQADLDLLRKAEQVPVQRRSLAEDARRFCCNLRKAISSSRGGVAYARFR